MLSITFDNAPQKYKKNNYFKKKHFIDILAKQKLLLEYHNRINEKYQN